MYQVSVAGCAVIARSEQQRCYAVFFFPLFQPGYKGTSKLLQKNLEKEKLCPTFVTIEAKYFYLQKSLSAYRLNIYSKPTL
jgi:hypothetical protein